VRLSANTVSDRVRRLRASGLARVPQVVSGSRLTGEYDFLLRIACVDASEFEMVVDTLKRDHGVRELRSRLVLHELDLGPDRLLDL
jgi:Lrp/AsnC family leucine-responsive transcriptional regulator